MNDSNGFFKMMCEDARNELASGEKGSWREVPPNVLMMACFGMLTNHLTHNITRPLWFFSGTVFVFAVGAFIHWVIGG